MTRGSVVGALGAALCWLSACASAPTGDRAPLAPTPRACPAAVQDVATCYGARDAMGAYLVIARPHAPNGALVVHAHGGPRLTPPAPDDSDEDLTRFAGMVAQGYAWVGSSYRQEGYGVRRAAADVERSRALYWSWYGRPSRTILHGQSWGGQIAAKVAELYNAQEGGRPRYDGMLITNGILVDGEGAYAFRADLRAVYQYYCRNHPSPDEAPYPLWQGLAPGGAMTRETLRARVHVCTGLDRPPAERTPAQARIVADIEAVTGVSAETLVRHLEWATFTLPSLIAIAGGNPFDNFGRLYSGSSDDAALNAGVARFAADPHARARLAFDSAPSADLAVPMLSLHAVGDPIVSARVQADFGRAVREAGREGLFLAVRVGSADHGRLPPDVVAAAVDALSRWVEHGDRPSHSSIRQACLVRAADAKDRCPVEVGGD